jgi:hypothetical protein
MTDPAVPDTLRVLLDRPQGGDPFGLIYVAETTVEGKGRQVAASPVFHPDMDPTAHRAALAQLESLLAAEGWQRAAQQTTLIGVRFYRKRESAGSG